MTPPSPSYFSDTHHLLRETVRGFVQREIEPHINQWEEAELFPRELYQKAASHGILAVGFDETYGGVESDIFHRIVVNEELTRCGAQGIAAGLGSHAIGLPPIQQYGTEVQKQHFLPPVLSGEKISALGITEANTGSDVANLETRAVRDGGHYIVNGSKMFITSGTRADWITTAVRTGGEGHHGISVLIIDRNTPGFEVSQSLKKMGWRCSDTAVLSFDDCKVPADHLIGEENEGFKILMQNFQMERLMLAVMAYSSAQLAWEASLAYAKERQAFGKPLIAKQVIRHQLAEMYTEIDVIREYVYRIASRMQSGEACLAEVAIAKNKAADVGERVANQAVQIHGGMGYMRESVVERIYRDSRIMNIGGGTHEIMNEIITKSLGF